MSGLIGLANRLLRPLETLAAILAGVSLVAAMCLVATDALMRYALNNPLTFQFNFTENYLLVAIICLALPWGFRTGGFIRISGFIAVLPPLVGSLLIRSGLLTSAGYCAVLAYLAGEKCLRAFLQGEVMLGVVDWPVYLSWLWIPIGVGLLSLRLLITALGPLSELDTVHAPAEEL